MKDEDEDDEEIDDEYDDYLVVRVMTIGGSYPVEKVIQGQKLSSDFSTPDICHRPHQPGWWRKFVLWRNFIPPRVMIVENL